MLEHFQQIFLRHNKALKLLFSSNYLSCNLLKALLISFDDRVSPVFIGTANFVEEIVFCYYAKREEVVEFKLYSLTKNVGRRLPKRSFP